MRRSSSEKVWSGIVFPAQSITGSPVSSVSQSNVCLPATAQFDEVTVLRMVGYLRYQHPGAGAAVTGAAGIAVMPVTASGTTSVLDAILDLDYPWLWWQPIAMSVGTGEAGSDRAMLQHAIDIRSKRIISRKENLVLLTTLNTASGNVTFMGGLRVLLLN